LVCYNVGCAKNIDVLDSMEKSVLEPIALI